MTMSLRTRLLLGLVGLAAVGLFAADAATYTSLHTFLDQRVDQQLVAAWGPAQHELFDEGRGPGGPGPGDGRGPQGGPGGGSYPVGTYTQLRRSDGTVVSEAWLGGNGTGVRPAFPKEWPTSVEGIDTFDAAGYRVRSAPTIGDGVFLVAIPLREMQQTLTRLFGVMLLVGLLVLGGLCALAWWIVRLGLRPLERIGEVAADIAEGDLSRRVEPADPRTEVGRLGLALNSMLTQIESAFAERTASEERLRRFLADASHELRTPLTSIRGYAELFRRGASERPDDLAKSMDRIEQEAGRMGVLVDDLLVLARLDQGRPLERRAVDVADLASDAVADARAVAPERTVSFDAADPVVVNGDEIRLRQVLANLISNALNHTPAGTAIDVAVTQANGTAVLTVADHGNGLPDGDAERVFERFYRADRSRARGTGGVGLGLSIVAAITHAHDGTVVVEQTPGGGATFRVTLPLVTHS
jgi:two-component system OmpR family sensor kinase